MNQTDKEFANACGVTHDQTATHAVIELRKRRADFGKVTPESLIADMKIIDTELIHPADSIDLIEFTFQIETILGLELDANDMQPLIDSGAEEMTVKEWISLVLEIRKRKKTESCDYRESSPRRV